MLENYKLKNSPFKSYKLVFSERKGRNIFVGTILVTKQNKVIPLENIEFSIVDDSHVSLYSLSNKDLIDIVEKINNPFSKTKLYKTNSWLGWTFTLKYTGNYDWKTDTYEFKNVTNKDFFGKIYFLKKDKVWEDK